jgi:hypothetical protein
LTFNGTQLSVTGSVNATGNYSLNGALLVDTFGYRGASTGRILVDSSDNAAFPVVRSGPMSTSGAPYSFGIGAFIWGYRDPSPLLQNWSLTTDTSGNAKITDLNASIDMFMLTKASGNASVYGQLSASGLNSSTQYRLNGHTFVDSGGYRGVTATGYVIDASSNGFLYSLQLTNQPLALIGATGSTLLSVTTAGVYASVNGAAPTLLGSGGGSSVTWPTSGYVVISAGVSANPNGLAPVNGNCLVGAGGAWTVGSCSGSGTAVTSVSGTGIISNSSSTGNVTLAWAGTSGGIPYFSGTTTTASSAALGATQVILGGGAGSAPNSSSALTFASGRLSAGGTGDSSFSASAGAFGNAYVHLASGSGGSAWDVKAQGANTSMTFDYGGASKVIIDNVGNITAGVVSGSALTTGGFVVISNQGSATTGGATNGTISATTGGIYGSVSGGSPILMTNTYAAALNQSLASSASPTFAALTLNGALTTSGTIAAFPASGNQGFLAITSGGASAAYLTSSGATTVVVNNSGGGSAMYLNSTSTGATGYLIIGGTSAAHMMTLSDSGGSCTLTGAAGMSCTSDIRLKTSISRVPDVLSRMAKLHPIEYAMKGNGIEAAGFDAAEARKLFPRAVMVGDDGYLQMSYTALVPYLWRAVQELSAEVETLKRVQ